MLSSTFSKDRNPESPSRANLHLSHSIAYSSSFCSTLSSSSSARSTNSLTTSTNILNAFSICPSSFSDTNSAFATMYSPTTNCGSTPILRTSPTVGPVTLINRMSTLSWCSGSLGLKSDGKERLLSVAQELVLNLWLWEIEGARGAAELSVVTLDELQLPEVRLGVESEDGSGLEGGDGVLGGGP